jgi:hypothetical protein
MDHFQPIGQLLLGRAAFLGQRLAHGSCQKYATFSWPKRATGVAMPATKVVAWSRRHCQQARCRADGSVRGRAAWGAHFAVVGGTGLTKRGGQRRRPRLCWERRQGKHSGGQDRGDLRGRAVR